MNTSTTIMRNIALVQEVLSGKSYAECASQFNMSVPAVVNSIKAILRLLKEHTDIDILESSTYSYLQEKKEEIKKYLNEPFPKTGMTPSAKAYLIKKYGKYYARDPGRIATEWVEVGKAFNHFNRSRDLCAIQNWLASEGHLVGNILTDAMLDFAWEALKQGLSTIKADKDSLSFTVQKIERTGWKTKLIIRAEIKEKSHCVTREFLINLLPESRYIY